MKPLDRLKHHVTGAIERGEKTAIEAVVSPKQNEQARCEQLISELIEKGNAVVWYASHPNPSAEYKDKAVNELKEALVKAVIYQIEVN